MTVSERIKQKIEQGLAPTHLEIINESHKHKGHGGYHPSGESHFKLVVVSPAFLGKSRVERQRTIYGLLSAEFDDGLHALSLTTLTPDEALAQQNS